MSPQDIISTANYYKNIHILDRQYKAVVLIEDMEDLWFWEGLLTQNTSGKYKFFGHQGVIISQEDVRSVSGIKIIFLNISLPVLILI